MKPSDISTRLLGGLTALLLSAHAWAGTPVQPDAAHLKYTGRIDFSKPSAPVLSWPNSSIEANFTGSTLVVKLDDSTGKNFFNVFIDGDLARPHIVAAEKGAKAYTVATGLAPGKHHVLITKRTEGEEGNTVFQGLELADDGRLLPPPPRKKRRIEFFGDSITSGMGNESADDGEDHHLKDKNSFQSYAANTARALDAEVHTISQSGIGVMISWFPFIMPNFYDQLDAVGDNDTRWDFRRWTPDVVVINLMQNDSWLIDREKRLQPMPDDAQRVAAYKKFVQTIRARYPKAYIVCALGSMDATRPGSKWPGYVKSAVAGIAKDTGDKRIDTLMFEFTGYGAHPRIKHHQANAAALTSFIKRKLNW